MVSSTYTKVLVKLNPDKLVEDDIMVSYQFLEPKLVTGYSNGVMIGIPINELTKQGVSFHLDETSIDMFLAGCKRCEDRPLYFFSVDELDVLVG